MSVAWEKTDDIKDLAKFVALLHDYPNHRWTFRGQGNIKNDLLPTAGRKPYCRPNATTYFDLERFKRWSHEVVAFCESIPKNELERLAYAQHYKLATRLLDWTANAVVALYFATEDHFGKGDGAKDGAVFAYHPTFRVNPEHVNISCIRQVAFYRPRPIVRRIIAQDGTFTFHPFPNHPLEPERLPVHLRSPKSKSDLNLVRWRVPAKYKRELQEQLRDIGVLARSVYPDVEGLSRSMNCNTAWLANPRKGRAKRGLTT